MLLIASSLVLFLLSYLQVGICTARKDCECGIGNEEQINFRIFNGALAFPHQYPWLVYMKHEGELYCGGSIINNYYILTAGHCTYNLDPDHLSVVIGGHDSEKEDGITMAIDRLILHENYTENGEYDLNDIALIKLKSEIHFNNNIRPICLPNAASTYTDAHVIIAGWGDTEKGLTSRYLLHRTVTIRSQNQCQDAKDVGSHFEPDLHLCAYGYRTDVCKGDSGSPLVYETRPYKFEVAGVVSWGEGCAPEGIPSIFVKVTHYLPWIEENTKDAVYCKT